MGRTVFIVCLFFVFVSIVTAADRNAKRILDRYDVLRPKAKDLAMYRLDWAESLDVAMKRAVRENRPVCLVIIFAKYGDMASGHC
tara:strand:+ start:327 stop:581 length:255 start_codon:yes stop_codon:yes gene_type:complete